MTARASKPRPSRSSSKPGSPTNAAAAKGGRRAPTTPARAGSAAGAGRHGKFNANGQHIDGHWLASEAEAERYLQLKDMLAAEKIANLVFQQHYDLVVNNVKICGYKTDFTYDIVDEFGRQQRHVIEDVKGMETPEFKLKLRLFNAVQPVPLSIIAVKGKARHSSRPAISDKTGGPIGSVAGWMDVHWKNRLPD